MRHSHKKWKDSLKSSLDQGLFAAKIVILRYLDPSYFRIHLMYSLNVCKNQNIGILCMISLCVCGVLVCLFYRFDIVFSIDFSASQQCIIKMLIVEDKSRVTLYRSNAGGIFLQLFFEVDWLKTIWKVQTKTKHCILADYSRFYLPSFFNIRSNRVIRSLDIFLAK